MNANIRMRLVVLGFAVALMGALIALVTMSSQEKAEEASVRLSQLDAESFSLGDHFRDKLRSANDCMRRFASSEDAVSWDAFLKTSSELKQWIEQQSARLSLPVETRVLQQMSTAQAEYLQRAMDLYHTVSKDGHTGASLAQFNSFFEQSRRFLDLGEELARVHYNSRNEMLVRVERTLTQLRLSVLCMLAVLFFLGVVLAVAVYRHLIAPLRVKLVESEALVERHEKLASLGLLAAGVAHEIRNPLTAIKTALYIQQKSLPPGSRAKEDAGVIEREILRLERIVTQFLQFARPAQPEIMVVPADLPLRETQALLAPALSKTGIQLLREESEPLQIRADPAQIKQVLINLVHNAADSIGQSGTITLRTRLERKRLHNGGTDGVVLEVSDNGKGIPLEVQKRLCDPFFTTKETGTGLGLAIAARLVALNGGALQYQTAPNRGSTFGIVLPKAV